VRFLIDTNILLHAANAGSPSHRAARGFLEEHAQVRTSWCITWPILYEFLRVSTHARVFPKPLTAPQALEFAAALTAPEEVAILVPTARHLPVLVTVVNELGHPAGNLFHDIHTAVLMREHGIPENVTADTDFLQFSFLKVSNPLR
jgi:toxin-antitoxin system PIN domain toxin